MVKPLLNDAGWERDWAIADPAGLKRVIEGQFVRDALCSNAQRPGRYQSDFAMAKPSSAATIIDDSCARTIRRYPADAGLIAVLELGELRHVGKALT